MGRSAKFLLGLIILVVAILAGLSLAVKLLITPERVIPVVEREAGKALGREVKVEGLQVGLFSGIELKGLTVKEKDPSKVFLRVGAFRLRYELWPLLHRRIVIKSLELISPEVHIRRHKGVFNYASLAILAPAAAPTAAPPGGKAEGRGGKEGSFSLAVKRLVVKDALLQVEDDDGVIPPTTARLDLDAGLGLTPAQGQFQMSSRFRLKVESRPPKGGGPVSLGAKGDFDLHGPMAALRADLETAGQHSRLDIEAAKTPSGPKVKATLRGDRLDLQPLLALASAFSSGGRSGGAKARSAKPSAGQARALGAKPLATLLPKGLEAVAQVRFQGVKYQGFEARDLEADADLKGGKADLTASIKVVGGECKMLVHADLNQKLPPFNGGLVVKGVDPGEVLAAMNHLPYIRGKGDLSLRCSGAGLEWPVIRKSLSCDGLYGLKAGRLYSTPITKQMAQLLGLEELMAPRFDRLAGDLKLRKGKVVASLQMTSLAVGAMGKGTIGLDGSLDFPITLLLAPSLAKKAEARLPKALRGVGHLPKEGGKAAIPLVLKGSVTSPRVSISTKGAEKALKKAVGSEVNRRLQHYMDQQGGGAKGATGGAKKEMNGMMKGLNLPH